MKRLARIAALILGLALVVYSLMFLLEHWQALVQTEIVNPLLLVLNIPLLLVNLLASGRLLDSSLRILGIKLSVVESLGLSSIGRFINYLSFAQLGFVTRMYYLRSRRGVDLANSLSGIAIGNLFFYGVSCGVLVVILFAGMTESSADAELSIRLLFALAVLLVIFVVAPLVLARPTMQHSMPFLSPYAKLIQEMAASPPYLLSLIGWSCTLLLTFTAMQWIEFRALGYDAAPLEVLLISAVVSLSALINITPAGLGVNEGLLFLAGSVVATPENLLLGSALLRRFVVFLTLSLLSLIFIPRLFGTSAATLIAELKERDL